jgi:hypothetical protein
VGEGVVDSLSAYPDDDLLKFLAEIQAVPGIKLVGLYLHGSLAYGDFHF